MTDYERHMPQHPHERDWGASVRTVMQGLILTGIVGVVTLLWHQNDATAAQNVTLGKLQVQIEGLQTTLDGVPALKDRTTVLEQGQKEILRRVEILEQPRNTTVKGWTR